MTLLKLNDLLSSVVIALLATSSCGAMKPLVGPSEGDMNRPIKSPLSVSDAGVAEVLVIGTQIDAKAFYNSGEFTVSAIPLDPSGNAVLDAQAAVTISLSVSNSVDGTSPNATIPAQIVLNGVKVANSNAIRIAVDVDSSGSMSGTDPQNMRIAGAKLFYDELATSRAKGTFEAAQFDFGGGADSGLQNSRLLQNFTSDINLLKLSTDKIVSDGGTPTYESLSEIMNLLYDPKVTDVDRRVILFSDGEPGGTSLKQSVCEFAAKNNIKIDSIGLGPASDISYSKSVNAVTEMRSIADCSGGSYFGIGSVKDAAGKDTLDEKSLRSAYRGMAVGVSQGSLGYSVKMNTQGIELHEGDLVTGSLSIQSSGKSATGTFQFSIPTKP